MAELGQRGKCRFDGAHLPQFEQCQGHHDADGQARRGGGERRLGLHAAEEQAPIKVKGFAGAVRSYKVLGVYDNLAEEGTVIREEHDGFKFHLQKHGKLQAIRTLEAILSRLKG